MMSISKRNISIVALAIVLAGAGSFGLWKVRQAKAKAAKRESTILKALTREDFTFLVKSQAATNPEKAKAIVSSPESKKAFLKGMKEYLSLAARARREGLAEDQDSRLNLQIKENALLSELYFAKLKQSNPKFTLSQNDIKSFWTNLENEKQFNLEIDAIYSVQDAAADSMGTTLGRQPKPQGEGLAKAKNDWAKARIMSDMARADVEFMQQRHVQLRLQILEAGVLSAAYLAKYWKDNIKATPLEIKSYLSAHPEWDLKKKRETAEAVLRRAKAGEDFAALVKEYSEDRPTKDRGGLYEQYELGHGLWEQVEDAAMKLQPGQIADNLIETKDGYHIVQLVEKTLTKGADGNDTTFLTVRHILLQRRFEDPTVIKSATPLPPPFKTPEEIAKTAVEREKRQRFVDSIVNSENISLPDDFDF